MPVTLVLGGAASGKSSVAERLVTTQGDDVVYVATGVVTDDDMAARIAAHKLRRPPSWSTIETNDLAGALGSIDADRAGGGGSLGTWVAHTPDFAVDIPAVQEVLLSRTGITVLVSDEVGLGVHPETEVGRLFRDAVGHVNRHIGDVCDEILLVVAGRTLRLT
jgi:adenosyl cobinamide kinase/adenosyl cobinamide phosphate guanylyltransferase